jgi:TolB protein
VWVNAGDTVAVTFRFACTPDTDSAAYVDVTSGVRHIVIASVNGGRLRRLMNSPGIDEDPAWSPDGKRIAFTTTRDANAEIYVMTADGTSQQRRTTNKSRDRDPAWSPDGRISFASDRDGSTFGTTDVYVMNPDGSQVTRLMTNTGADPAWSGDGRLAYTSVDCRYYYCQPSIVVRALSRADSLVDVGPGKRPSWSPDGRKLAYEGFVDCAFYYYECLPGGLRVVRLNPKDVSSLGAGTRPAWRP